MSSKKNDSPVDPGLVAKLAQLVDPMLSAANAGDFATAHRLAAEFNALAETRIGPSDFDEYWSGASAEETVQDFLRGRAERDPDPPHYEQARRLVEVLIEKKLLKMAFRGSIDRLARSVVKLIADGKPESEDFVDELLEVRDVSDVLGDEDEFAAAFDEAWAESSKLEPPQGSTMLH
ncbi:MAG TPA: hypothetical protein VF815_23465 [Myxococcaceae bacterium]|jgi:hypothetical protein